MMWVGQFVDQIQSIRAPSPTDSHRLAARPRPRSVREGSAWASVLSVPGPSARACACLRQAGLRPRAVVVVVPGQGRLEVAGSEGSHLRLTYLDSLLGT